MNRFLYSLLILALMMLSLPSSAQKLTVDGMQATNDLSASQYRRKDLAGEACALVKVQLATADVGFEGNVIQPVEYKGGEYWVYMTKGSRELRIKHLAKSPAFVPCHVSFGDYGITGLESLVTYNLTLLLPQSTGTVQYQKLIINYQPKDAMVLIDSEPYSGGGHVEAELPLGEHTYMIAANGYITAEGMVKLNGGSQRVITEQLEMKVSSQPSSASSALSNSIELITVKGVSFNMVRVEGGTFQMGATSEQGSDVWDSEKPVHQVTLSTYYMGETEVTQELWETVMGSNPSSYKGAKKPVEQVSWDDCQTFIQKLKQLTGRNFRLPTEAEWEYAARGGNKSRGYKYSGSNTNDDVAWCWENSGDKRVSGNWDIHKPSKNNCRTHDVKTKQGNELGLYDMSGNVWEWCQDWSGNYSSGSQTNPTGASSGSYRVYRGGCSSGSAFHCRVSIRNAWTHDFRGDGLGLRLAL